MKSKGYTLIEILIAVSIIGLLFGVGYANYRDFSRRQSALSILKNIQGDLRLAQQLALSGQKPDDTNCDSPNTLSGYSFGVLSATSYEIRPVCSGGAVSSAYKTVTLGPGATFSSPFPSPNPIVFKVIGNGTNTTVGSNAQIILTETGSTNTSTITVNSAGQIQ